MKRLQELLEIFRDFEIIIHQEEFSQFTIDFIQDTESKINYEMDEDLSDSAIEDLIGSIQYQTVNVLDIIKDGKDKDLFSDLEKNISVF